MGDAPLPSDRSKSGSRLLFLDQLRFFVIFLVIILHAAMTYMAFPPEWWYVIEPENSLLFTALVLWLDVPIMPTLFFVSGYFAYRSIEKHGPGRFLRQKIVRIGLPWLFAVIFLAPAVTYLIPVTRGGAAPYLEFWLGEFWGPYYQQSVYWYLGILLLFFALFAALYQAEPRWQGAAVRIEMPTWRPFAIVFGVAAVWFFTVSTTVNVDTWSNLQRLFVFQPARLLLYAAYFGLGIYAERRGWFLEGGYAPPPDKWLLTLFVSGFFYLGYRLYWAADPTLVSLVIQSLLFNVFCLSGVLGSVAIFQSVVQKPGRAAASLARNAYAIYYLHPLILYPAAYAALALDGSIYVEALLLVALTAGVAWGIGAGILTRWPLIRQVF